MLIVHAAFSASCLYLWAEDSERIKSFASKQANSKDKAKTEKKATSSTLAPRKHPFAATGNLLETRLEELGLWKPEEKIGHVLKSFRLPTRADAPLASSSLIDSSLESESKAKTKFKSWEVETLRLPLPAMFDWLDVVLEHNPLGAGIVAGADLLFWAKAMRFAGSLVARQSYLPDIEIGTTVAYARWRPLLSEADANNASQLAAAMPVAARSMLQGARFESVEASTALGGFLEAVVDFVVRSSASGKTPGQVPIFSGHSLHERWVQALVSPDAKLQAAKEEIEKFVPELRRWQQPLDIEASIPWRLCFLLEEPTLDPEAFRKSGDRSIEDGGDDKAVWKVRYLLQARDEPSLKVPLEQAWQPRTVGARLMSQSGFNAAEYLLTALGRASAACPPIGQSLRGQVPTAFNLDTEEAFRFLTDYSQLLEHAGFGVFLPAWWSRQNSKSPLSVQAKTRPPKFQGNSGMSLEALIEFDWEMALGGQQISLDELQALARLQQPLVNFRGQWVQLNQKQLQAATEFWRKRKGQHAKARDLLFLALGAHAALDEAGGGGSDEIEIQGVRPTGWLDDLIQQLQEGNQLEAVAAPQGFQGQLRPYQQTGYAWLNFLRPLGLGACLADDMGLGKTVQVLALLQRQWESQQSGEGARPTLLICPTSVVANWHKEAARFTPDLPVVVHHGAQRARDDFRKSVADKAIVISSYALLHRDLEQFQSIEWANVILDEAQNIKNSETKQAKAARALNTSSRIAMTGTPVENNIGDLWSLMEFLNPGLLGKQSDFRKRFFLPIQNGNDPVAIERLKKLVGPFILRRLKTDKSVIADLPEKMEMKVFCSLTREQASLYKAVVNDALSEIGDSEGIERRGRVLGMIAKLKQVCNHPAHFSKDNTQLSGRSGKLERLTEMMEEILTGSDNSLIFTQFYEMGALLQTHLQETFGQEVLFLHGGTSKKARDAMVTRFQQESSSTSAPRIFILSLKAGGVGLNLTRANHVFHFDRWWNPAIENQATDRAFRIGQTKNVQVHKFLCAGTLEERIDEMIESKQSLATNVLGTGEKWLTELSTTQLRELLTLRADALSD